MKKTGLFKILLCVLLGVVLLSWLLPSNYFYMGELMDIGRYRIGFFDIFQFIFGTFEFQNFVQVFIFILSVGAFYGVLGKTGKYRAWIDKITSSFKGKEWTLLVGIAVVLVGLSSAFNYGLLLFIFIPFLIGLILSMGYDKITAFVATFGAVIVGEIGSTVGYNVAGLINDAVGITFSNGIFYKLMLLVLSLGLLIFYLVKAKHNIVKKVENKVEEFVENDLFIGEKISNKYSVVTIIVMFCILFVLLILGCTKWSEAFNLDVFSNFHNTVMQITVGDFELFKYVLGEINSFGNWYYAEMSVMLILASLVIGKFYRMKFIEILTNMANGLKKVLKPALLMMLCYAVFYFNGNSMTYPTIAKFLIGATKKFNFMFTSIAMALGAIEHVDMLYISSYVVPQLAAQDVNATTISLISQGIYGVVMLVAPTSIMLVIGLSYLGISYTEYIKKIWKYLLIILGIVFAVIIIQMLETPILAFLSNYWLYCVIGLVVIICLVIFLILRKKKK
jgi:uncharacterized ion transporter superfamily protein YfcC